MGVETIFENLWKQYTQLNPKAQKIFDLLEKRGEKVLNDHVAFRTFDLPEVNIDKLSQVFLKHGYKEMGDYHFEAKKLYAKHFEHENKDLPKVFISQLLTKEFSENAQALILKMVEQVKPELTSSDDFCFSGRPWSVSFDEYTQLMEESEYAAWLSAFGFCANHFTVNINALSTFDGILDLNEFIKTSGFTLNSSGGEVKGSPEVYLEQSSTMADEHSVNFEDGEHTVPTCYYEFALRHNLPSGELYHGFVAKSADKIFESTNKL